MNQLLRRIERHLKRTQTPPTVFGRRAVNDPRLVRDLRGGREIGADVAGRIDRYLLEQGG